MKANQIKAGGHYTAKVSGVLTTVRVDEVTDDRWPGRTRGGTRYHVTNLRTGRKTVFRSPQKFRAEADTNPHGDPLPPYIPPPEYPPPTERSIFTAIAMAAEPTQPPGPTNADFWDVLSGVGPRS